MDLDGFVVKKIALKDLIPVSYDDYLFRLKCEVPILDFIEMDLIYKDQNDD